MTDFVLHLESVSLRDNLMDIAQMEGKDMSRVIIEALETFVQRKKSKIKRLDPLQHSVKIAYPIDEDVSDVRPFARVKNSALYAKKLRTAAWQRGNR